MDEKIKILNSTVVNSAIGSKSINQSNNMNSFNTTHESITDSQKALMCEVIDATLKYKNSPKEIIVLAKTKDALEKAKGQLPESNDPQVNSLLKTIWQGMKELDSTASMAERGIKYLSPIVSSVITFLSTL